MLIDNETVKYFADKYGEDAERLMWFARTIPKREAMHQNGPLLYQGFLSAILMAMKPQVVVETGVRFGVCSLHVLHAMSVYGSGALWSCDPMHDSEVKLRKKLEELYGDEIDLLGLERWTFEGTTGNYFLPSLPIVGWDVFIHDSDHSEENMAWELDYAWRRVRPGGLIVCDDWQWPDQYVSHKAWDRFALKHDLNFHIIGTAAIAEVPVAGAEIEST